MTETNPRQNVTFASNGGEAHGYLAKPVPAARLRAHRARAAIPAQSLIEQMAEQRAPVPFYAPRSAATRSYRALFDEVLGSD